MNEDVVADGLKSGSKTTDGDTGAQTDDLDSVLSEIDKEFYAAKEKVKDTPEQQDELTAQVAYLVEKETNSAVNEAVQHVKAGLVDLDVNVSDKVVKSMLNIMAVEDPRVKTAFDGRFENPARWDRVLKGAVKEIAKEFTVDQQLTRDRETVANAIRGSKTVNADSNVSFEKFQKNASDYQIQEWKLTGKIPESYRG